MKIRKEMHLTVIHKSGVIELPISNSVSGESMSFPKPSDLSFYFCTAHFSHSLSLGLSQGPGVEVVRVVGVKDPLTLYL